MKLLNKILVPCITCLLMGCTGKNVKNIKDFTSWLADEENGYTITKTINNMQVSVSLLPPEYMAAVEMDKKNRLDIKYYDSLITVYKYQVNMLMTIKSKDGQNILYKGVKNEVDYTQRLNELNFAIENLATLHSDGKHYHPALTAFENNYGLTKDVKINLLFTPTSAKDELLTANVFDFEYSDESFDLGTIHCFFNKKNISGELPALTLFKN